MNLSFTQNHTDRFSIESVFLARSISAASLSLKTLSFSQVSSWYQEIKGIKGIKKSSWNKCDNNASNNFFRPGTRLDVRHFQVATLLLPINHKENQI